MVSFMLYLILGGMYMIDAIVFTQSELNAAIDAGASHIVLCDNNFELPSVHGIIYTAVGRVTASADFSNPEKYNIVCANFSPKLKRRHKIVHTSNKAVGTASIRSSFAKSSYSSSYKIGSYSTSYRFSQKYLTSYVTSYITSYRYNYEYEYRTSYSGSYSTSYRLSQSYKTSFFSSFKITSFIHSFKRIMYDRVLKEISVNGYGIHLI